MFDFVIDSAFYFASLNCSEFVKASQNAFGIVTGYEFQFGMVCWLRLGCGRAFGSEFEKNSASAKQY